MSLEWKTFFFSICHLNSFYTFSWNIEIFTVKESLLAKKEVRIWAVLTKKLFLLYTDFSKAIKSHRIWIVWLHCSIDWCKSYLSLSKDSSGRGGGGNIFSYYFIYYFSSLYLSLLRSITKKFSNAFLQTILGNNRNSSPNNVSV